MSLYQCESCGCMENTACGYHLTMLSSSFDWSKEDTDGSLKLCSACAPAEYIDGTPTKFGKWHGIFDRVYLPKGQFKTNCVGNLEHIETGETDIRKFKTN